tara:strand:- start:192 stop:503 length:312 start_codon:yes stop_codon:yes gene_type:complete
MTQTHTPTPWIVSPPLGEGAIQIQSTGLNAYGNWIVAEVPDRTEEDKANAAFIVRACNAHEELVAALEELLNEAQVDESDLASLAEPASFRLAIDALKKAKEA